MFSACNNPTTGLQEPPSVVTSPLGPQFLPHWFWSQWQLSPLCIFFFNKLSLHPLLPPAPPTIPIPLPSTIWPLGIIPTEDVDYHWDLDPTHPFFGSSYSIATPPHTHTHSSHPTSQTWYHEVIGSPLFMQYHMHISSSCTSKTHTHTHTLAIPSIPDTQVFPKIEKLTILTSVPQT